MDFKLGHFAVALCAVALACLPTSVSIAARRAITARTTPCDGSWEWLPDYPGDNGKSAIYAKMAFGQLRVQVANGTHLHWPMTEFTNPWTLISRVMFDQITATTVCNQADQASLVMEFNGETKSFPLHRTSLTAAAWSNRNHIRYDRWLDSQR